MAPKTKLMPDAENKIAERKAARALAKLMEALAEAERITQNGKKLIAVNQGQWQAWINAWNGAE
jgi:hypothetical protein